jgi:PAS domain S-box-containing protein
VIKKMRFISFLLFLLSLQLSAQVYDFKTINQENGLPSSVVTTITQDSRNIMWIGTDGAGLVKYDGKTFYTYDQSNGLEGNFITNIVEDANNNLVFSTKYNGIYVFDGYKFIRQISQYKDELLNNHIACLLPTEKGTYGINGAEFVLVTNDYKLKKLIIGNIPCIEPNSMVQDGEDIYIGAANGLFKYTKGKIIQMLIPDDFGYTFVRKVGNKLLVSTYSGNIYKIVNSTFEKTLSLPKDLRFNIKNFFVGASGNIWIAGDNNQGLYLYNGLNYLHFNENNGFTGENISCFYQSQNKELFIGTTGTGMFVSVPQLFYSYRNVPYLNNSLIFAVLKDDKHLYAGIRHVGIASYLISDDGNYSLKKKFDEVISPNTLIKNNKGDILAGCSEGLFVINNNRLQQVKSIFKDNHINNIKALAQDDNGNYLVGTLEDGLLVLDQNFKLIKELSSKKDGGFSNSVLTIHKKDNHTWYIGTNTGLYELKVNKQKYEIIDQIISDVIGVATFDVFGNYWCTGSQSIFSVNNKKVKTFTKKNGLNSTLIYTLTADQNGCVWAGHNLGIDKIEVNKSGNINSIKNFNSFNGFKGLETNMRSQFIDDDGDFYLGTVKGLVSCNTTMKISSKLPPKIIFTNLKILNRDQDWRSIKNTNKWFNMPESGHEFESKENQLTFEYSIINAGNSANYLFSYKLQGLDQNWSSPSNLNEVTYSNLNYGDYEFLVKVTSKEGDFKPELSSYKFSIKTPFYLTWWFITLVLSFVAILITLLLSKSAQYNKEFVKDYSEEHSRQEEIKLYFLFFGIVAPLTEVVIYFFELRKENELVLNIVLGLFCLAVYYFSGKISVLKKYLYPISIGILLLYTISTGIKIYSQPFELITYSEFFLALFFSQLLISNRTHYWFFNIGLNLFILSLFYTNNVSVQQVIVLLNFTFISILIYEIRHVSQLNSKARLLFTDTIVNKGNSLVIASNLKGEIIFISKNVKEILGYEAEEMLGLGWWKLTYENFSKDESFQQKILNNTIEEGSLLRKIKTKWGAYKWIQWSDKRFGNETIVGIGQDVTERIHAQNQYRNLIQTATDIIYESNKYGDIVFINKFAEKLLGYETTEMIFNHYSDFVREDYKPILEKFYLSADKDTKVFDAIEFPLIKKNGEEVWVSQKVSVKRDDEGNLVGYSGIIRDISKIKAIELAIKESENNFRQINETIDDVFWLYDILQKKYLYITPSCEKVLGLKDQEVYAGKSMKSIVHHDDLQKVIDANISVNSGTDYTIEYRIFVNDEIRWINEKSFGIKDADGRIVKNSGICADITDRKVAEDKLKESENNFRQINETIEDVFWLYDILVKKYIYISPNCEKVLGMSSADFHAGIHYGNLFVVEEDKEIYKTAELLLTDKESYNITYRIKAKDGNTKWINEKSFAIRNVNGQVIRNSGICTDITETISTQQKLADQAEIVKQYSKELEFQNTIKERLILCKTIEEVCYNTLGFIKSNLLNTEHIALLLLDEEKNVFNGYHLKDGILVNEEFNISNIKSFEKCNNGEIYIEPNLNNANFVSESDKVNIKNGVQSYIIFPLHYDGEMIAILSIGFSKPFALSQKEIESIKDASEIISITVNQISLKSKLEQYSKDLEFQNTVKQKLINASSIEEITSNALRYIMAETNECKTIAVSVLDDSKMYLQGFKLLAESLVAETWKFGYELKCYESLLQNKNYIEFDLTKSETKSYTDDLYKDKGERSYIVLPIHNNNELIGALSLGFQTPFQLSKQDIGRLEEITFILGIALKQVKLNNSILEKNNDITSSISYAKDIQYSILPDLKRMTNTLKNVTLLYRPKDIVSGDFYGAIELERYTFLFTADCTGHGVPGAFLTLLGNMIIEQLILSENLLIPNEILTKLDQQIFTILNQRKEEIIRDGMEIALCRIDKTNNSLLFSGAGMGLLYYIDEKEYYFKGQRKAIGEHRTDDFKYINHAIDLSGKEQFYMATDGFQDQLGGTEYKRFSKNELMKLLAKVKFKEASEQEKILNKTLDKYIGKYKQIDDITIIGFTVKTK